MPFPRPSPAGHSTRLVELTTHTARCCSSRERSPITNHKQLREEIGGRVQLIPSPIIDDLERINSLDSSAYQPLVNRTMSGKRKENGNPVPRRRKITRIVAGCFRASQGRIDPKDILYEDSCWWLKSGLGTELRCPLLKVTLEIGKGLQRPRTSPSRS
jgi:hypothetical protein